jgi:hypothetical protein
MAREVDEGQQDMVFRFPRYRSSPATNGGVVPSRPLVRGSSAREAELQRELDTLLAERAALVRQERAAAQNLARMQDSLDVLAGEIDRRARTTRDHDLRDRAERMIARVKSYLSKQDGCDIKPATVTSAIKVALGLEPSPHRFASPLAPQVVASPAPQATAQAIIDSGARARGDREAPDVVTGRDPQVAFRSAARRLTCCITISSPSIRRFG